MVSPSSHSVVGGIGKHSSIATLVWALDLGLASFRIPSIYLGNTSDPCNNQLSRISKGPSVRSDSQRGKTWQSCKFGASEPARERRRWDPKLKTIRDEQNWYKKGRWSRDNKKGCMTWYMFAWHSIFGIPSYINLLIPFLFEASAICNSSHLQPRSLE